jgi:ribosomal protein S18 acetylase RimI-like enzyme
VSQVIVRAATEADLPAIHAHYDALMDETIDVPFLRVRWEHRVGRLRASITAGLTLVAESDGSLVAFIEGSRLTGRLGWIRNIYVTPRSRRNGIARALIEALARRFDALELTHVGLNVGRANDIAGQTYARLGFEEFSRAFAIDVERLLQGA